MTTVGVFAGRGDVILAMGLAILVGIWIGWHMRGAWLRVRGRITKKPTPTT